MEIYDVEGNKRFPLFVVDRLEPGDGVGGVTPLVYFDVRSNFIVDIVQYELISAQSLRKPLVEISSLMSCGLFDSKII